MQTIFFCQVRLFIIVFQSFTGNVKPGARNRATNPPNTSNNYILLHKRGFILRSFHFKCVNQQFGF